MSAPSQYSTGLLGTTELSDILGFLEEVEGFGDPHYTLGNVYDDSSYNGTKGKPTGNPTIGYGFNLFDSNVLGAVLDGLVFTVGSSTGNVFVLGANAAQAAGNTVESAQSVVNYFSWLVKQYRNADGTLDIAGMQTGLDEALQQFFVGNGSALINGPNGMAQKPTSGAAGATNVLFSFAKNTAGAEHVLINLITLDRSNPNTVVPEGLAGNLVIAGKSPEVYRLMSGNGVPVDSNTQNLIGASPTSPQLIALTVADYNGLPQFVSRGLANSDPAQSWYRLRYTSGQLGPIASAGFARRGYLEAQMFGLNGSITQNSAAVALQDYEMLEEHRGQVFSFEAKYGINPDSPGTAGAALAQAVTDAQDMGLSNPNGGGLGTEPDSLVGVTAYTLSLAQQFAPEEAQIMTWLASQSPLLAALPAGFQLASSTDIFVGPSQADLNAGFALTTSINVNAGAGDGTISGGAQEASANHIVIGMASGETLTGGEGNDIILAGAGNEALHAGAGSDTLVGGQGDDLLVGGAGTDVFDIEFGQNPAPTSATETIVAGNASDSIYINGTRLGAAAMTPTGKNSWTDGTYAYRFIQSNISPAGLPAGVGLQDWSPWVGELQISPESSLNSSAGTVDILEFNLQQAESSASGYLGISLAPSLHLTPRANAGVDPPGPDFAVGSSQSYTVWVDAPSVTNQTVTLTLAGAPASDFEVDKAAGLSSLDNDGTFTVTIAAGETSASFSLTNTADVGRNVVLQLSATMPDPANSGGTVSAGTVTQNYVEPTTDDPFAQPAATQLVLTRQTTTSDGQAYNLYDLDFGGTPVASVSGGNNLIRVSAAANQSISGGSGNDTIDATFGAIGSGDALVDGGVDVITGNGGQDFIIAASPFTEDSNVEPHSEVRIYAGSQVDIPTAIANANSGNGTGQQGDLFDSDVSNATIVGGNGNDLIFDSGADLVIAGSGDDTILSGVTGVYHNTTRLDGSIDA